MAFPDPLLLGTAPNEVQLSRVPSTGLTGTYKASSEGITFTISHQYGRRTRSTVRLTAIDSTPVPGTNIYESMTAYIVIDRPNGVPSGMVDKVKDNVAILSDFLASSGAIMRIVNGEA